MCILCRWLKLTVSGTCWRHSRPSRLRVTCHSTPTAVCWSQTRWTTASFCWTATWNNRPSSSTLTPMLRCGGQWDCASMNPHCSSTWPTKRSHPPSTLSQYSGYPEQLVHRRSLLHEKSHPPSSLLSCIGFTREVSCYADDAELLSVWMLLLFCGGIRIRVSVNCDF